MKTSTFLSALQSHSALPLVFRHGREDLVSPGYHLTEVKRVAYETMDCGAMTHQWAETHFELWVPPLEKLVPGRSHMPAGKFLGIVERVQAKLPLNGDAPARLLASFKGQPAALYDVETVVAEAGKLWVELSPDRTRCKAVERRVAALTGGCCAATDKRAATNGSDGCGCDAAGTQALSAGCCV